MNTFHSPQLNEQLVNCLRIHRRKAGLSQEELGKVLGYDNQSAVAKHERFESVPPFLIALGYEVIFQVPAAEMFPGLRDTVALGIEQRLEEFERHLQEDGARVPRNGATARKLVWLNNRRSANRSAPRNP